MKFKCATCDKEHDLDEISFGSDAPATWGVLTDAEREASDLFQEQCIIRTQGEISYYIRACLKIPIRETDKTFTWGVWCSLSEKSFEEMGEHWEDPARTKYGPYFGWFVTKIPFYPDTMFLKSMVHQRPVGERPLVELEPTNHPLALHQREGIGEEELKAMVMELLHAAP